MTDDFQLLPDSPLSGGPAIDADIALITAYLARELSLGQVLAIEERLNVDAPFREKAWPIIEGWLVPGRFGASSAREAIPRIRTTALNPARIDAGWARYVASSHSRATPLPPRSLVQDDAGFTQPRGRVSLIRIAALIAVIVLPIATFAQLVVYAANHTAVPGHGIAQRFLPPTGSGALPSASPPVIGRSVLPLGDERPGQLLHPMPAGQPGVRTLLVKATLTIPGVGHRFLDVHASRSGVLAVRDVGGCGGDCVRLFSATGDLIATVGGGVTPGLPVLVHPDFGWVGDSLWLFSRDTFALVDPISQPRVIASRVVPNETPGPPGTTPRKPTIIPFPSVRAAYPDGGLLISQAFPPAQVRIVLGQPDLADEMSPSFLVRTTSANRFQSFALSSPLGWREPCYHQSTEKAAQGSYAISLPFCRPPDTMESPDGRLIAYARADVPVSDPARVHVTQVVIGGDTTFSRTYSIPSPPVDRRVADSIRVAEVARASRNTLYPGAGVFVDSLLLTEMPRFQQPVKHMLVGNDGTVILELLGGLEGRWLVLGSNGDVVGAFILPSAVIPLEVSRGAIWGVLGPGSYSPIRFTIGP